uniref:8-oxo-dGTP diphosphatase MutT n=1 Tax=Thaumasiovibrio occultus TaxID=1891184 RepID=UPI000B352D92|nr:8-oxo-dGTP diphosphatase MutT [Thaumasiovibrio occultus]
MTEKKQVYIAVGIILSADRSQIFITQRAQKAHKGGFWEFAGGKVEDGESAKEAVVRELSEEVGISVTGLEPFMTLAHDYPEKSLSFDFFLVTQFGGEPFGKEGQPSAWVQIDELRDYDFPEANAPVIQALMDSVKA